MKPADIAKKVGVEEGKPVAITLRISKPNKPLPAPSVNAGRPANLLTNQIDDMVELLEEMKKSQDLNHIHVSAQNEVRRRLDVVRAELRGIKTLLRR